MKTPRLAARALILQQDRLLLVNAYAGGRSDLWCAVSAPSFDRMDPSFEIISTLRMVLPQR